MRYIIFLFLTNLLFADTSFYVKDINISGLTQISKKIALEDINIKSNQVSEEQINQIIKKFYSFGYFKQIIVNYNNQILHFKFIEKPFISDVSISGYKTDEEELKELYKKIGLTKGSIYTKEKLKQAKKILLKELELEGYNNSVIEFDITKINDFSVAIKIDVNKGDEILIKKIKYIGAKKLNEIDFEDYIANKEEDLISWWFTSNDGIMRLDQLEYDSYRIKDVYLQHGFLDAIVSKPFSKIDFNTNSSEIIYHIFEGEQYKVKDIKIKVLDKKGLIDENKTISNLKLKKNKIFDISKLRKDINYLKTIAANKGYAYADVTYDIKKYKKEKLASLYLYVKANQKVYINDVIIKNNSRTLDRVIRRDVYLAPKDLYNETDFKDSIKKLKRTGFFKQVTIKKKKVSNNLMDLIVEVEEAPTGSLIVGGGYGSYDGWIFNASIKDKNIFGSGKDLSLNIDHSSKNNNIDLSLFNPAINDSIYDGSISIYHKKSIVTSNDNNDKITRTLGISSGVGRGIGRNTRVGTILSYEEKDTTYAINTQDNTNFIEQGIKPYIRFNNTDNFYVPRSGIIAGSSLYKAGFGGDAKYMLSNNYFKYFYGFRADYDIDVIFRYKANGKILFDQGLIPSGTTFYLGGARSVRGYQSYAIQPDDSTNHPFKKYLTNTIEFSFPLIPKARMRWSIFYDNGMIGYNRFNEIKKSGYGVSIDWYSPVGPLQFIFARAINPEEDDKTSNFEFSLGTAF